MTNLSGTNLNNGAAVGPQGEGRESPSTFPKYPAYKDSGVEWLEKVPAGWTVSKLGYFFREPPCYGVLVPDFDPDGVPMLRITDMEHEFIDASGLVTISPSLSAQYARTIVQVGDVVLSLVGTIGKAFEISPKLAGVNLSRAVARIQLGSNTLPRYLCWIFQSCEFTHFIDLVCKGTAQRVLNLSDLNAFSFTFPSYSEQCAISRFLDHETARIDALIEEQQRLIELLKEKRQAVISHAVTKGLDPAVPMKDSGVEWLGEVPAHWRAVRLRHCLVDALTYGANEPSDEANLEHPRYIRITDLNDDGTLSAETYKSLPPEKAEPYMLEEGDVLFARSGATVGKSFLYSREYGPACYAGYLIRARVNKRALIPMYLWMCTQSRQYEQFIGESNIQATIQNVSAEKYGNMWIALPEIEEQERILAELEIQLSQFKSLMETSVGALVLLQERRSALISAAVTGKIDVRGWQPPVSTQAPEPAVAEAH